MKELVTLDAVATKLYQTICNMEDALILERCTFENGFCHFVIFRNAKGIWVVYTNKNYTSTEGWCSLRMYHMQEPISFAKAYSNTLSFNQEYCKLCETSPKLISIYSSGFTPDELLGLIDLA